ncbi:MAG: adaptor protein MecA [Clostridia bacterium]|nr:adaptor protein MecA [Clostridia bacterium]
MKIEKLNENKIKITLNSDDLKARNIDVQSFIYNTPESQDLFWDVMREAEKEYGFTVDESMVYVEASATATGIFTLTVTKTANSLNQANLRNKLKKTSYKLKRKNVNAPLDNSIYCFNSFDDICDFCNSTKINEFGINSLYEFESKYYLLTTIVPNSNILEYSVKEHNTDMLLAKIAEYGKKIIEKDALKTISKNFAKK